MEQRAVACGAAPAAAAAASTAAFGTAVGGSTFGTFGAQSFTCVGCGIQGQHQSTNAAMCANSLVKLHPSMGALQGMCCNCAKLKGWLVFDAVGCAHCKSRPSGPTQATAPAADASTGIAFGGAPAFSASASTAPAVGASASTGGAFGGAFGASASTGFSASTGATFGATTQGAFDGAVIVCVSMCVHVLSGVACVDCWFVCLSIYTTPTQTHIGRQAH
jgi:hypothetical protein